MFFLVQSYKKYDSIPNIFREKCKKAGNNLLNRKNVNRDCGNAVEHLQDYTLTNDRVHSNKKMALEMTDVIRQHFILSLRDSLGYAGYIHSQNGSEGNL